MDIKKILALLLIFVFVITISINLRTNLSDNNNIIKDIYVLENEDSYIFKATNTENLNLSSCQYFKRIREQGKVTYLYEYKSYQLEFPIYNDYKTSLYACQSMPILNESLYNRINFSLQKSSFQDYDKLYYLDNLDIFNLFETQYFDTKLKSIISDYTFQDNFVINKFREEEIKGYLENAHSNNLTNLTRSTDFYSNKLNYYSKEEKEEMSLNDKVEIKQYNKNRETFFDSLDNDMQELYIIYLDLYDLYIRN